MRELFSITKILLIIVAISFLSSESLPPLQDGLKCRTPLTLRAQFDEMTLASTSVFGRMGLEWVSVAKTKVRRWVFAGFQSTSLSRSSEALDVDPIIEPVPHLRFRGHMPEEDRVRIRIVAEKLWPDHADPLSQDPQGRSASATYPEVMGAFTRLGDLRDASHGSVVQILRNKLVIFTGGNSSLYDPGDPRDMQELHELMSEVAQFLAVLARLSQIEPIPAAPDGSIEAWLSKIQHRLSSSKKWTRTFWRSRLSA